MHDLFHIKFFGRGHCLLMASFGQETQDSNIARLVNALSLRVKGGSQLILNSIDSMAIFQLYR
jgi:hypothetical protein